MATKRTGGCKLAGYELGDRPDVVALTCEIGQYGLFAGKVGHTWANV